MIAAFFEALTVFFKALGLLIPELIPLVREKVKDAQNQRENKEYLESRKRVVTAIAKGDAAAVDAEFARLREQLVLQGSGVAELGNAAASAGDPRRRSDSLAQGDSDPSAGWQTAAVEDGPDVAGFGSVGQPAARSTGGVPETVADAARDTPTIESPPVQQARDTQESAGQQDRNTIESAMKQLEAVYASVLDRRI